MPRGKAKPRPDAPYADRRRVRKADPQEIQSALTRTRARGSKYGQDIAELRNLDGGEGLIFENLTKSEVTGLRQQIKKYLDMDRFDISSSRQAIIDEQELFMVTVLAKK
jgi:hypothetical protein